MTLSRDWITPLTMGAFLLSAVTGVLMFFHLDSGLNKAAHEWLSWALLAGVAGHVLTNVVGFKRHLAGARGRALVGAFALVLGVSFLPLGGSGGEPPFVAPVRALGQAPLPVLAQVAGLNTAQLRQRLAQAGVQVADDQQTLAQLVGPDTRKQLGVMKRVFAPQTP
jgi:Domain of unknown function (DUF4405)